MRERELARFWEEAGPGREWPGGGGGWRVLFPGRPRPNGGPDFQGALLRWQGEEVRGDVEVHVRARDWLLHGHHQDPRFNGVVLHVVLVEDSLPTQRQDGQEVAVLPLHSYFPPEAVGGYPLRPCGAARADTLEGWGEERFGEKAKGFRERLAREDPDQVLYEGLMRALGYSRNPEAMEGLAQRLPWAELAKIAQGLAPGQEPLLLSLFRSQAQGLSWQWLGIRPANHPWRRLEAMSHLILRYPRGLVAGLALRLREGIKPLEEGLMVPRLLGRGRAGEMAVNVLLPFFWALGEGRALELYRAYPPLPENEITRWLRPRLVLKDKIDSARCQQGLIHLFKVFCEQGRCCPLRAA